MNPPLYLAICDYAVLDTECHRFPNDPRLGCCQLLSAGRALRRSSSHCKAARSRNAARRDCGYNSQIALRARQRTLVEPTAAARCDDGDNDDDDDDGDGDDADGDNDDVDDGGNDGHNGYDFDYAYDQDGDAVDDDDDEDDDDDDDNGDGDDDGDDVAVDNDDDDDMVEEES